MRSERWKLHLSVAVLALAAMTLALTPASAGPLFGTDEYPDVAFLARNDVPFDAQTAASMAAQLGAPMFITNPTVLSDAAANGIADFNPDIIVVAGGVFAISDAVAAEAAAQCDPDCTIDRRWGNGRDETAADLATIPGDYGFDRPALQGAKQTVGDVHIGGTVHTDAITVQDTGLVSGLNADRVDGMHASDFLGATEKAADSDKVDGLDANAISRVAYDFELGVALDGMSGIAASTTITAPTDGLLVLSGSLDLVNTSTADTVACFFVVDGTALDNLFSQTVDGSGSMTHTNMSLDGVEPVASGSHTVEIACLAVVADTDVADPFLVVQFVPFGPDGIPPTP